MRDWATAEAEGRSLAPFLTRLNEIRRAHPALQQLRDLTVHASEDPSIVVFSKRRVDGDCVIVVVNIDPHGAHATMAHLDLEAMGLPAGAQFEVHDELTGQSWTWGTDNYVRLDPSVEVAHILSVRGNG